MVGTTFSKLSAPVIAGGVAAALAAGAANLVKAEDRTAIAKACLSELVDRIQAHHENRRALRNEERPINDRLHALGDLRKEGLPVEGEAGKIELAMRRIGERKLELADKGRKLIEDQNTINRQLAVGVEYFDCPFDDKTTLAEKK